MKSHFVFLLFLLSILILIVGCSDEPSSLGIEILESDYIVVSTFDSQTDTIVQSSSFFKDIVPLGASDWVLIGKYQSSSQTIASSTLLKFIFNFPDSLKEDISEDSINVLDSWVILTNKYVYGDTLAAMDFTTHKVNSTWSSSTFTVENLPSLQYDPLDISSEFTATDTLYSFHLDDNVVYSWMKNSVDTSIAKNYGIYLEPTSTSNKIIGFQALTFTSSDAAKLFVVIEKPGAYVDTINGIIAGDISAVAGTDPILPSGLTAVQSSVTMKTKLTFDVGVLPFGLIINSARLIVTADSTNSVFGSSINRSLSVYFLDSNDSLDTEGSPITLSYKDNEYSGDITSFVRNWVSTGKNHGMLIQPGNQLLGTNLLSFIGSNYSDVVLRPRVVITYTIKRNL